MPVLADVVLLFQPNENNIESREFSLVSKSFYKKGTFSFECQPGTARDCNFPYYCYFFTNQPNFLAADCIRQRSNASSTAKNFSILLWISCLLRNIIEFLYALGCFCFENISKNKLLLCKETFLISTNSILPTRIFWLYRSQLANVSRTPRHCAIWNLIILRVCIHFW